MHTTLKLPEFDKDIGCAVINLHHWPIAILKLFRSNKIPKYLENTINNFPAVINLHHWPIAILKLFTSNKIPKYLENTINNFPCSPTKLVYTVKTYTHTSSNSFSPLSISKVNNALQLGNNFMPYMICMHYGHKNQSSSIGPSLTNFKPTLGNKSE